MKNWPFLSEECEETQGLHPRWCGLCGDSPIWLLIYQEHDGDDQPLPGAYFVLCLKCAEARIDPHPRLYRCWGYHAPCPGAMPLCVDCVHRAGTVCLHPDSRYLGGKGLALEYPSPTTMFVRAAKGHGGPRTIFPGPVTGCPGKLTHHTPTQP